MLLKLENSQTRVKIITKRQLLVISCVALQCTCCEYASNSPVFSTMFPLVNVTVGLHWLRSSSLGNQNDYTPSNIELGPGLACVNITHVLRTFNLMQRLRLGNAVIIFNQTAINMTGIPNHKSIQTIPLVIDVVELCTNIPGHFVVS